MADSKVFEFTPNEASETGAIAGGVQKVIDDYLSGKTAISITSYQNQGNTYVVVVTS